MRSQKLQRLLKLVSCIPHNHETSAILAHYMAGSIYIYWCSVFFCVPLLNTLTSETKTLLIYISSSWHSYVTVAAVTAQKYSQSIKVCYHINVRFQWLESASSVSCGELHSSELHWHCRGHWFNPSIAHHQPPPNSLLSCIVYCLCREVRSGLDW